MTDAQLISAHLAGDPAAFPALVRRHLDMVHAAATRQAPDFADDITQAVFLLLHQKARSLRHRPNLAGWLFTTTRSCASHARRAAHRRRIHEREAAMHNQTVSSGSASPEPPDHAALLPLLDTALASLPPPHPHQIKQRHLQNRPLEDLATELAISVPATTKRAQRALDRLRAWFMRHGHIIPTSSLSSALLAQSAHRAPAILATARASSAATAIAKAAAPFLLISTVIKLTAAAALLLIAAVGTAVYRSSTSVAPKPVSPVVTAAPIPAALPRSNATVDETKVPGETRLAQIDVLLDTPIAEDLRKLGTPVESKSKPYVAHRVPTADLFDFLYQAFSSGQLLTSNGEPESGIRFALPQTGNNPPLFIISSYIFPGNNPMPQLVFQSPMFSNSPRPGGQPLAGPRGSASMGHIGDTLHLRLDQPSAKVGQLDAQIRFEGDLHPGESLLLLADIGDLNARPFNHALIWSAVKATDDQFNTMRLTPTAALWVKYGPAGMRDLADRKRSYGGSQAPVQALDAKFTRALPNGASVSLIAISAPSDYAFLWWRPDGLPSDEPWERTGVFDGPSRLTSTAAGSMAPLHSIVLDFQAPLSHVPDNYHPRTGQDTFNGARYYHLSHVQALWNIAEDLAPLRIGIAAGPWTEVAILQNKGEFRKDAISLKIIDTNERNIGTRAGAQVSTNVVVHYECPPDTELRLVAVDNAGKGYYPFSQREPDIDFPSIMLGDSSQKTAWDLASNYVLSSTSIDHFIVQTRHREWTTIDDFAQAPSGPVPEHYDPKEVLAARERLQHDNQSQAAMAHSRGEWLLLHAGPTTPEGAVALIISRARAQ